MRQPRFGSGFNPQVSEPSACTRFGDAIKNNTKIMPKYLSIIVGFYNILVTHPLVLYIGVHIGGTERGKSALTGTHRG